MEEHFAPKLILLEEKIKKLIEAYNESLLEVKELKEENAFLKSLVKSKEEEVKNFQNQFKISKIVTTLADDTHRKVELKLKINEYIREIDKCIAYLKE
jgi:FtsZ-binding cell division protein ZapB